jgi:hypothetical protein
MRISLLPDQAMLRDIRKGEQRVSAAVHDIDISSTEFRRFSACCFKCSTVAAASD